MRESDEKNERKKKKEKKEKRKGEKKRKRPELSAALSVRTLDFLPKMFFSRGELCSDLFEARIVSEKRRSRGVRPERRLPASFSADIFSDCHASLWLLKRVEIINLPRARDSRRKEKKKKSISCF